MAASVVERVYVNRDNDIELTFYQGTYPQSPVDFTDATRVVLTLTPPTVSVATPVITVDSDVDTGAVDWDTGTTGLVRFVLGGIAGVVGESYTVQMVVYDAVHTQGQVFLDGSLPLRLVLAFYSV